MATAGGWTGLASTATPPGLRLPEANSHLLRSRMSSSALALITAYSAILQVCQMQTMPSIMRTGRPIVATRSLLRPHVRRIACCHRIHPS